MATIIKSLDKVDIYLSENDIVYPQTTKPYIKPKPDIIYHYTSIETFRKILISKSLRATNLRSVNDTSEYYYGVGLLYDRISKYEQSRGISLRNRIFPHPFKRLFFGEKMYCICFTENGDNVAFWNSHYIQPNNAVAIGFNVGLLESELFKLNYCIYGDQYPDEMDIDTYLMFRDIYKHPENRNKYPNFIKIAFQLSLVKDSAFIHEKEWRMVSLAPRQAVVRSFKRGSKVCYYIDYPIDLKSIEKIIVGPGESMNENKLKIDNLRSEHGIQPDISFSQAPLNL